MSKQNFISASDQFDLAFHEYFSKEKLHIREKFNRRDKKLTTDEFSYRVINHWEQNGLLEVERGEVGTGWRKYSLADLVWLNLISELRKFGVSIENIRKVKEQLTHGKKDLSPSVFPMLEFYTAYFFMTSRPVFIMIFQDFKVEIADENFIGQPQLSGLLPNHIKIGLHGIVQAVFKHKKFELKRNLGIPLSDAEQTLILELRTGACKSVNVKLKNGKIIRLDKEMENVEQQLHRLLREKNYDSITIDRENGDIVNIKQVIKEKL